MVTRKRKSRIALFVCSAVVIGWVLPSQAALPINMAEKFSGTFPGAKLVPQTSNKAYYLAHSFRTAPIKGNVIHATRDFLETHRALFGLSAPATRVHFDKTISHLKSRYVRFDQYIDNLPVFERKVVVHLNGANRIVKVNSTALSTPPTDYQPVLDAIQAYEFATQDIVDAATTGAALLGYFPIQDRPILAYKVISSAPGPHLWVTYVNAVNGSTLMRYDMIKRHKAMVYQQNPKVTPDLVEVELEDIVTEGEHEFHTYGSYAKVASCETMSQYGGCSGWRFDAVATEENGFLDVEPMLQNNPVTGDGFAELMVYDAATKQNKWYRDTFNFTGQWYDSEEQIENGEMVLSDAIWIYVNANYQNGYFAGGSNYPGQQSGAAIVLGYIGGADLAYDNDVVLHELGHAVSSVAFSFAMGNLDEFGIDLSAGGLEEGQADYFAATTYGNSQIGEYAGVARVLENSNSCPESLMGESHHDGQIVAGAMWDIRSELGKEKADQLIFGALAGNSMVTFGDFGRALIAQAEWMASRDSEIEENLRLEKAHLDYVQEAIDARSIIGCERIVTVGESGAPVIHFMPFSFGEQGIPSPVQYRVTTGPDTTSMDFIISIMGDPSHDVLVREGEPVYFNWIEGEGYWDISWEAEYDARWNYDIEQDLPVEIATLAHDTELQLKPNTDYYFSIICKTNMMSSMGGCQNLLSLQTSSDPVPEPEDTDSSVDEKDTEDDRAIENDGGSEEVDGGDLNGIDGSSDCDCRTFNPDSGRSTLFGLLKNLYFS